MSVQVLHPNADPSDPWYSSFQPPLILLQLPHLNPHPLHLVPLQLHPLRQIWYKVVRVMEGANPGIGGVLVGVLLITIFVAVIFPCARRRQKRLKLLTEGDGSANVLHRDVEVSELLKIPTRISRRSSEDKYSLSSFGHHGASFFIFFPFKGLREVSIYLNDLGSISRENLALMSIRTPSLSKSRWPQQWKMCCNERFPPGPCTLPFS